MPETPDFEKLAGNLAGMLTVKDVDVARQLIVAVWNARGAADVVVLDETCNRMAAGNPIDQSRAVGLALVIIDTLAPAIQSLDR